MNESVKRRAAAIRDHISKDDELSPDPGDVYRFSVALATWDALRLQIDKGPATVGDDRRFVELTDLCQDLSEKVGLGRELTLAGGFLVGCASERIICDNWQEAARGYQP
jgi:hypothetical protein